MLQKIISFVANQLDRKETDSEELKNHSQKCQTLFDGLSLGLDEEQKKKLLELDFEYFMKAGQCKDDGYKEGLEIGFKLAFQLILDSLRNPL